MTANTPQPNTENVHLGELCKVDGCKGTDTLLSPPIAGDVTDVIRKVVNSCPWAGIDMGTLPEESGE